ncbi:unnamed protein product [Bemisia tabaci]|uniref:Protein CDV3 homolog n=1 Tax=Bemisia tabaci TaxID=7038 RepID=A0A9P0G540_BEMTA|nr:unnamed protein product [Bemisia tabaci]
MADLDDFFAKKDRKKSKTTKKFTTTDDLAKKLEETSKKTEKLKKEKMTASSVPTNNLAQDIVADETAAPAFNDEDEWKEFTEEKKDYSSLKIQHLQISENDAENGDQNDSNYDGFDEEGNETQPGSRRKQGPWKMVAPQPQAQPEPEPEPKPAEVPPAAQPASGKYISPALRQAMMQEKQLQRASWSLNIFMWLSWRVFGVFCTPGALRNVYRAATADMLA